MDVMEYPYENILQTFIRKYTEPFTVKDVLLFFSKKGIDASANMMLDYLETDRNVFSLENKMFIGRAGAFTNQIFSFLITKQEFNQGVFVAGDRCMPFVDSDVHPADIKFSFLGSILPKKEFETDSSTAMDLFSLYGDEYSPQYIGADPANEKFHIPENNFELPTKLLLTGVSLEPLLEHGFSYGDRILAHVIDWDRSIVEIFPIEHKDDPYQLSLLDLERGSWNEELEKCLLDSFDKHGPCSCIEEQLALVFFEHRKKLCTISCGSFKEFLKSTKKVSIELFGVETRLWRRDELVPAVGKWNGYNFEFSPDGLLPIYALQDFMVDAYLKDLLFEKKTDVSSLLDTLLPRCLGISDSDREYFLLNIMNRNAILRKNYNWFADSAFGALRHRALVLFSDITSLLYEFDFDKAYVDFLPQQELAVFSQLYTHVMRILSTIESEEFSEDEASIIQSSLEGMECNFADIKPELLAAVEKIKRSKFSIVQ